MTLFSSINPPWLKNPLNTETLSSTEWHEVVNFFLICSPCNFQSNRKNDLKTIWGNSLWISRNHLVRRLNFAIFGKNSNSFYKSKKDSFEETVEQHDLGDTFGENLEIQRAVYLEAPYEGNSSIYMSLFYHLRNSIAHARFSFEQNKNHETVMLFEDGKRIQKNSCFEVNARGILKLESLTKAINVLQSGPQAIPDIDQQVYDAICAGLNTRKKVKRELDLSDQDWMIATQMLKLDKLITCDHGKWEPTKATP